MNLNKRKTGELEHDNYMAEGMCFGLRLGLQYLSRGLLAGMCIQKREKIVEMKGMNERMIQNIRKWFALICAILLYYLIHEGSHVIVALVYGVFDRIRILGVGVQVVAKVELLSDIQIAVFCMVGSIATLFSAYLLVIFSHKIADRKSKVFRAIGYYMTLVFLLLDPLYLSFLYKFVGGGDMNGILLLGIPEIVVRVLCGIILLVNVLLIIKKVYPVYKESFNG